MKNKKINESDCKKVSGGVGDIAVDVGDVSIYSKTTTTTTTGVKGNYVNDNSQKSVTTGDVTGNVTLNI